MDIENIETENLNSQEMISDNEQELDEKNNNINPSKKRAGRPKKYASDQERKEAKRKHALEAYYRKKAKRAATESGLVDKQALISDVIELMVDTTASKQLDPEVKPKRFRITGELKLIAISD